MTRVRPKPTNLELAVRQLKGAERLIRDAMNSTPTAECAPLVELGYAVTQLRFRTEDQAEAQRRRLEQGAQRRAVQSRGALTPGDVMATDRDNMVERDA